MISLESSDGVAKTDPTDTRNEGPHPILVISLRLEVHRTEMKLNNAIIWVLRTYSVGIETSYGDTLRLEMEYLSISGVVELFQLCCDELWEIDGGSDHDRPAGIRQPGGIGQRNEFMTICK
jgi:hypothetical protein